MAEEQVASPTGMTALNAQLAAHRAWLAQVRAAPTTARSSRASLGRSSADTFCPPPPHPGRRWRLC
jgi:hypothetical protein